MLGAAQVAGRWFDMDAWALSNLAWSLASLPLDPGEEWLTVRPKSGARASGHDEGAAVDLFLAMRRLAGAALLAGTCSFIIPGGSRVAAGAQGFTEASLRALPACNSFALSVLLWAHVTWGRRPHEQVRRARSLCVAGPLGPRSVSCQRAGAHGALRLTGGRAFCVRAQWLGAFFSAAARTLPSAEPQHIARVLWCCASMGLRPPGSWLRRVLQQTQVQVRRPLWHQR